MYTKAYCSFCFAAKNLLAKRGLEFEEIPIAGNRAAEQEMPNYNFYRSGFCHECLNPRIRIM